ncbi:hypothetical protein QOZ80_3BG0270540 [Eleusine coracana subsp. coracana]|nr:hypothetical protein QOZ80_3BG0270540 [Eleusine coracana subsp. coracana]
MQMVVFQGHSDRGINTTETPITKEFPITQDDKSIPLDESECSDDDNSDEYHLEHDPGVRAPILSYPINDQDSVRRAYILLGPCQPRMKKENFPQHKCGGMHRFQPSWFDEIKWLEYSVKKDAACSFVCYLFKDSCKYAGGDAFIDKGSKIGI